MGHYGSWWAEGGLNPPLFNMPTSPDTAPRTLVFSGEFRFSLDEKKRLTVPSRWRAGGLSEVFIIRSLNRGCLAAVTQEMLEALGEEAASQAGTVADHRTFKDHFFSKAVTCPIDSQGRMVLPEDLCRFAGIKKELVLAGGGSKFDIWNPESWERHQAAMASTYETILKNLGI